ncbi:MAG TPA: hypothetical protein VFQ53_41720 [Kofleriaceae bacterium]|nr:hypothetical protein [Kofleriaceae bacterium]
MAKNESTAVNELINLVATQQPLPPDPSEDLMFSEPKKPSTKKLSAPRMTSTVPPVNAAGEVAPLPRTRAPHGTQQLAPVAPPVRMSTAPATRAASIPPIPSQALRPSNRTLPPPTPTMPPTRATSSTPAVAPAPANQTLMGLEPFDGGVATVKSMPPVMENGVQTLVDQKQTLLGHSAADFDGGVATIKLPNRPSKPPPTPLGAASPSPTNPRETLLGQASPNVVSAIPPIPPTPAPKARPTAPPSMPIVAPFETKAGRVIATSTLPALPPQILEPQAYPVVVPPPPVAAEPVAPAFAPMPAPMMPPAPSPFAADVAATEYMHAPPDMTSHQGWFDDHQSVPFEQHDFGGTQQVKVKRANDWKAIAGKLVMPMIGLTILGIFIGGYFAFDGDGGKKRTPKQKPAAAQVAPAAAAAPTPEPTKAAAASTDDHAAAEPAKAATEPKTDAPADEPGANDAAHAATPSTDAAHATVAAKPEPKLDAKPEPKIDAKPDAKPEPKLDAKPETKLDAQPKTAAKPADPAMTPPNLVGTANDPTKPAQPTLVDVRIDSKPSGATVMLVDRGKTSFLGTTPISTALDPSRTYELVLTAANKPTQIEKLDPSSTKRVMVELGKKPRAVKTDASKKSALDGVIEPKPEPKKVAKTDVIDPFATKPATAPAPAGDGVLMISSKPPCEIEIDGKPTGLVTPQKDLKLPVGKHKITLINATEKIRKTLLIQITADQPTKVIQDLMK